MLLSIIYASTAREPFTTDDLAALLAQSRHQNERLGLTGLLVHRNGRFLQLIEGPAGTVQERMAAIQADPRHGQVRVLLEDEIDRRQFPDWTMGYESEESSTTDIPGFRRTFDDLDADRSESGTLPALRALIAWFRQRHDG